MKILEIFFENLWNFSLEYFGLFRSKLQVFSLEISRIFPENFWNLSLEISGISREIFQEITLVLQKDPLKFLSNVPGHSSKKSLTI